MLAGTLKQRVSVERLGSAQDSFGQVTEVWTVLASRRASIDPISGKEYYIKSGEGSAISTKIVLRYDSLLQDVSSADRVVNGSDVYDIESVINTSSANHELILMCVLRDK